MTRYVAKHPREKKLCVCGKIVACYPPPSSSKARVPHKCPHGVRCIAGSMGKSAHGFNRNTQCWKCIELEIEHWIGRPLGDGS